jgi:Flp pilus assembly CpaF family ATPase
LIPFFTLSALKMPVSQLYNTLYCLPAAMPLSAARKFKKAPLEYENMLEMGAFHERVVEFCK